MLTITKQSVRRLKAYALAKTLCPSADVVWFVATCSLQTFRTYHRQGRDGGDMQEASLKRP
jgi:hypothetical protein